MARIAANLTQESAAESVGVSRQTMSSWENGKSFPDIISIMKLSDLYDISIDDLVSDAIVIKRTKKDTTGKTASA